MFSKSTKRRIPYTAGLLDAEAELVPTIGAPTPCPVSASDASSLTCVMPSLPAGSYQLRITATTGYAHPLLPLTNAPRITAVEPPAGSLAGGQTVTIRTEGVPLGAGISSAKSTSVAINGMACNVIAVAPDSVTCETSRAFGAIPAAVRVSHRIARATSTRRAQLKCMPNWTSTL